MINLCLKTPREHSLFNRQEKPEIIIKNVVDLTIMRTVE
jgi:hypothetical protein